MKKTFYALQIMICVVIISSCEKENQNLSIPKPEPAIKIGESHGGGIVFYVDDSGQHGLVTSTSNQSTSMRWFNGSFIETAATGIKTGTGSKNTEAIITAHGVGVYAASICDKLELNGYNDWFLPSKDELNLLYMQKAAGVIGDFENDFYWSSTENSYNGAWSQSFSNGANSSANKDGAYDVRAIRAF
ncbi:MAG: DUF1566 domain-containing protein [Bacteroidia bacterium]|nr:DUF1566 domain-containing protein [Bacteroidia bacterium]